MPKSRSNGSGSLRHIRDDIWRLRANVGKDPITGKYRQLTKTITATSQTTAQKALTKWLAEIQSVKVQPSQETYGWVLDQWLNERRMEGCEANTLKGYERQVKYVKDELGQLPLNQVTRDHVKGFYRKLSDRGLGASTIRGYRNVVSGSLAMAEHEKWAGENAALRIKLPKMRKPKLTVPTQAQVFDLLAAAKQHRAKEWHYYLPLAVASWCRRGELTALRWDHVDFSTDEIFIEWAIEVSKGHPVLKSPKGHTNRRLALDPRFHEAPKGMAPVADG